MKVDCAIKVVEVDKYSGEHWSEEFIDVEQEYAFEDICEPSDVEKLTLALKEGSLITVKELRPNGEDIYSQIVKYMQRKLFAVLLMEERE